MQIAVKCPKGHVKVARRATFNCHGKRFTTAEQRIQDEAPVKAAASAPATVGKRSGDLGRATGIAGALARHTFSTTEFPE